VAWGAKDLFTALGRIIMNKNVAVLKWSLLVGAIYFLGISLAHMMDIKVAGLFVYFDVPSFNYQNKIISFLSFGWSVFLFFAFLDPEKNISLVKSILVAGTGAIIGLSIVNLTTDFHALSPNVNVHIYWFETAILALYLFWLFMLYLKIRKR
jgi:hypothetical protein